jgi:hypothetical protein
MKKPSLVLSVLLIIFTLPLINVSAQTDNAFTPYGKPLVLVYTNVNSSFNKTGNSKAFELTRAYLGYEYFFSKNISSRVNIDIADPGAGKLQMTAFIKNAFLLYNNNGFSARFGMIGVDQFNIQEKQWGYRYIYKSFQDAYNFGPSADLGAGVEYSPAEFITLDLSVLNGEGYKKLQSDSTLKTTLGLTIRPFTGLVLRGYYDRMKNDYAQTSIALYAGYSIKVFKAGFEYNIQKNNSMINSHDFSGVSVYTSLILDEKFSIFCRYDNLKSVTPEGETAPWNQNKDGQLYIAGFDYSPTGGVKIAPTYLGLLPFDKSKPFTSTIALNIEIKF